MKNKNLVYLILAIGALIAIISLTADITGLGQDPINFGWKQILGTSIGLLMTVVGIIILIAENKKKQDEKNTNTHGSEKPGDLL